MNLWNWLQKLKKKKNLDLLSKGTALLSKANEKRKELSALESDIDSLAKKRQRLESDN